MYIVTVFLEGQTGLKYRHFQTEHLKKKTHFSVLLCAMLKYVRVVYFLLIGARLLGLDTHVGQNNHIRKCFKVSCRCFCVSCNLPDTRWSAGTYATSTIWCTDHVQKSGYLQSCFQSGDSSTTERASVSLVSAAVGLTNTKEEHAGRQTRRQRQGAVNPDVCSTDRESRSVRENMSRSHLSAIEEFVKFVLVSHIMLRGYKTLLSQSCRLVPKALQNHLVCKRGRRCDTINLKQKRIQIYLKTFHIGTYRTTKAAISIYLWQANIGRWYGPPDLSVRLYINTYNSYLLSFYYGPDSNYLHAIHIYITY